MCRIPKLKFAKQVWSNSVIRKKKITNQKQKDKETQIDAIDIWKKRKKIMIIFFLDIFFWDIFFWDILGIFFLMSETLNQTLNNPPIYKKMIFFFHFTFVCIWTPFLLPHKLFFLHEFFFYKLSAINIKLNIRMQNNWFNQRKIKNKANKPEHKKTKIKNIRIRTWTQELIIKESKW